VPRDGALLTLGTVVCLDLVRALCGARFGQLPAGMLN
jgi:hypothetical protein